MVPSIEEGRIVLIANPVSKSGRGAVAASEAARLLRERVGDGRFGMLTTAWAGHGESLARELGPDVGCVIALGGDWDGATVPAFLSDASKMPKFQNMLSKHFGKTVMQKLCSDNALAFFERY